MNTIPAEPVKSRKPVKTSKSKKTSKIQKTSNIQIYPRGSSQASKVVPSRLDPLDTSDPDKTFRVAYGGPP